LLVTIPSAANRLSLCTKSVHRLIANGLLPVVKIGRAVRIPSAAIDQFIRERTQWRSSESGAVGSLNSCRRATKDRSRSLERERNGLAAEVLRLKVLLRNNDPWARIDA